MTDNVDDDLPSATEPKSRSGSVSPGGEQFVSSPVACSPQNRY